LSAPDTICPLTFVNGLMTAASKGKAMPHLIVSEVARRIPGARPKDISDLFYQRRLDDRRCPIVGGRRLIPIDYLPEIEAALRKAGRLPAGPEVCRAS
jgi:hypothetical protein